MANVFKRLGGEYLESVNTPDFPDDLWIKNPLLVGVENYPVKYWKAVGEEVHLMTQEERVAVDILYPLTRDQESITLPCAKEPSVLFVDHACTDTFTGRRFLESVYLASARTITIFYSGAPFTQAEVNRLKNIIRISVGKGADAWGTNALFETPDTMGMHDFSDYNSWPAKKDSNGNPIIIDDVIQRDSSWIVNPSIPGNYHYGKKVLIKSLQFDLDEDFYIHPGGAILVELYSNLVPFPLAVVTYADMKDILSRATSKAHIPCKGGVGPAMQYNFTLATPPMLYPTVGLDATGIPKLNRMVVRIQDNLPYKKKETETQCSIAKGRYFCDVFTDLDFVAP